MPIFWDLLPIAVMFFYHKRNFAQQSSKVEIPVSSSVGDVSEANQVDVNLRNYVSSSEVSQSEMNSEDLQVV